MLVHEFRALGAQVAQLLGLVIGHLIVYLFISRRAPIAFPFLVADDNARGESKVSSSP
jgi:hypothetical protein